MNEELIEASLENMRTSGLVTSIQLTIWERLATAQDSLNLMQIWVLLDARLRAPQLRQELSKLISLGLVIHNYDRAGIPIYKAKFV